MVELVIICAQCDNEYMVSTNDATWECPDCGHVLDNRYYPFLSARLMEAKRLPPESTDWNALYHLVRNRAGERISELKVRYDALEKRFPDPDLGNTPDIDRLDDLRWKEECLGLIERGHTIILMLEKGLK